MFELLQVVRIVIHDGCRVPVAALETIERLDVLPIALPWLIAMLIRSTVPAPATPSSCFTMISTSLGSSASLVRAGTYLVIGESRIKYVDRKHCAGQEHRSVCSWSAGS